ncbi:MAG TPA: gliding motility-associated ABC transporter substrate-binding protein GldG [Bacteroidales bacterium]|nr:gliding motility-associated ABC transporter substrate-binding protein GldG [Bacteroidales bacterium]
MVTKKAKRKRKNKIKNSSLMQLFLSLLILVFVNIISYFVFTRFDLTAEKRYTLSESTKKYLKQIDDVVYFQVYLDGEFPAGFKRLRSETKEMLDEFRAYNDNIQYTFINPSEGNDKKKIQNTYEQLVNKGIQPTNIKMKTADGSSQQWIFPGAIVSYRQKEVPVQLFTNQLGTPSDQVLNNSVQNLEYNLSNAIRKLLVKVKPRLAFTRGHGELGLERLADIMYALSDYYDVDTVDINGKINSLMVRGTKEKPLLNKYAALIIAKPDSAFAEKDKYFIDQFIMHGGSVLWLLDPVFATMDSLQKSNTTLGIAIDRNLDDMLFNYGVRVNTNLLLDMNALPIPAVTGQYGGQPKVELLPWYYFPVIMPTAKHPIVSNLNAVKMEFTSTVDTVGGKGIKKTILLSSSKYSRVLNTPVRISLDMLQSVPDERQFNRSGLPVAVLLEGSFSSVYLNRLPPEIMSDISSFDFKEKSPQTKMIVVSDGDVIKNQLDKKTGNPYPLGYDQYTGETFGNKDFILNCIDYMCDGSGIISVRSREVKMRLLDKNKINNAGIKLSMQLINTIGPVLLVLIFGIIQLIVRRYRFTRK